MNLSEMISKLEEIRTELKKLDNDEATLQTKQWCGFGNNEILTVIKTITFLKESTTNV